MWAGEKIFFLSKNDAGVKRKGGEVKFGCGMWDGSEETGLLYRTRLKFLSLILLKFYPRRMPHAAGSHGQCSDDATDEVRDKGGNVPDMAALLSNKSLRARIVFPSIAKKEHVRALVLSRKCDQTNPVQLDRPCD